MAAGLRGHRSKKRMACPMLRYRPPDAEDAEVSGAKGEPN